MATTAARSSTSSPNPGTNQFHGSGFYFFRRPSLDSNDFFSNLAGQPKGPYTHDQYGGSIRKQNPFFFFDLEKTRNNSPFTLTTSVPTALQRRGDFSQTFNPDGSLEQIFNPCPKDPMALTDGCLTPTGTGDYTRQPFTGNVLPSNLIDPIAQAVINLLGVEPQSQFDGQPLKFPPGGHG